VARDLTTAVITSLTHSALVRINRVTNQLEPDLAERWNACLIAGPIASAFDRAFGSQTGVRTGSALAGHSLLRCTDE
jgi:hypothetical protein